MNKKKIIYSCFFFSCIYLIYKEQKQKNVLFISIDDLRPELGCYGQTQITSPNIDSLASKAVVFKSAVCNVPVCGASRHLLYFKT